MSNIQENIQENNEKILNDIQSLQQIEQNLFNELENNNDLTTEERSKMIEKMNQLSNMRINLYKTLSNVNIYYDNALNSSNNISVQQKTAIDIVENELNKSKRRLQILEEEKNNKVRLVEINTYFGEKYAEHIQLMKIIIYMLLPIIIILFLRNKGLLPNVLFNIILIIISVIGSYYFWNTFSSILMRDNMNYNEYDWYFNANDLPQTSSINTNDVWNTPKLNINLGSCIGNGCCSDGLVYDSTLDQCVIK
jgi:hypothetical protein